MVEYTLTCYYLYKIVINWIKMDLSDGEVDSVNGEPPHNREIVRNEPYWRKTAMNGLAGRTPICGPDAFEKMQRYLNSRRQNMCVSLTDLQGEGTSNMGKYLVAVVLAISNNTAASGGVKYTTRVRGKASKNDTATTHNRTFRMACLNSAPGKNVFHIFEGGGYAENIWKLDHTNRDNGVISEYELSYYIYIYYTFSCIT